MLFCALLAGNAEALLYDDFNDGVLGSNWNSVSGSGLFTEHDGMLYFDALTSSSTQILSTSQGFSGDVHFSMEFYHFSSTNNSAPGVATSSALQLTLGRNADHVSIVRGANTMGGFLEFNHFVNGSRVEKTSIFTNITTGMLGLYYDGSSVYAAYSDQVGQDSPWYTLGGPINPGWTTPVPLAISGATGTTGATSFQIDNIGYTVPEPSSLALIIFGFAGIEGLRRRLKK